MTGCMNVILAGGSAAFPEKAGMEIAAQAAEKGYTVRALLLSGEKAGGGYACHVRIGSGAVSPVIPEGHADLLLSDAPWEALRQLPRLKKDGQVVTIGAPSPGETPFRVTVTGDDQGEWFWPRERTNISDAYTQVGQWGANIDSKPDWYKSYLKSKIVKW